MPFREYYKPTDIAAAIALLQRKQPRTAVLAGGTWLLGEAPADVEAVVDISGLGFGSIERSSTKPVLQIGATVTLQELVEYIPAMSDSRALSIIAQGAEAVAALNIRNRATIGGTIATADTASPLITTLLACDAELVVMAGEERTITMSAYLAYREPLVAQNTLITAVRVPVPSNDTRSAYDRVARTPKDYPIVCAAASLAIKDGIAGHVRVAVGGAAPTPIRLTLLELELAKKNIERYLPAALDSAINELSPVSDWLGSAEYRKAMSQILVKRVVQEAARLAES